jgi:hypothetical protein
MRIFILYRSYRSYGRHSVVLANINQHWDASCRPDPDFSASFASTGLCRSPVIQNFIDRNQPIIDSVYYFYRFKNNGKCFVAITAKLRPCHTSANHSSAYLWYVQNNIPYPPVNVVVDSSGKYRNCLCNSHSFDATYYNRRNNKFIHFQWIKNCTNRPIEIPENRFLNYLTGKNATLLNPNARFISFKQLQGSAIVLP